MLASLTSDVTTRAPYNLTLKCWGENSKGQLVDGTTTSSDTPVTQSSTAYTSILDITTGWKFTCIINQMENILCRDNYNKVLGFAGTNSYYTSLIRQQETELII